jgi:hypothetical protein
VSSTVLIAAPEHLPLLKERSDLSGAIAFPDTDALQALDAITRQRPTVVALERLFAGTSRGAAFINRIKADPALASCEIRIVAHDSAYSRVSTPTRRPGETPPVAAPAAVAEPPRAEPPRPGPAPLDQRGTRRAPRFKVVDNVEVLVDGNPATLIDVSVVGAQVLSATTLRPNQRLRMSLPDAVRPIRFNAGVAWAAFEMPKGGPRYRAGIEFYDAEADAVMRFIDANKK